VGLFDRISEAAGNIETGLQLREVDPELIANGLVGNALVKTVAATRISFGTGAFADPVLAFDLEVRVPDREPYAAALQQRVPHIYEGAVIPGATVAVRVDRTDPGRLAIDFNQSPVPAGASASTQAADPSSQLERLAKLHEQGVVNDDELAEMKKRLLSEI